MAPYRQFRSEITCRILDPCKLSDSYSHYRTMSDELEGGAYITGYGSFPISIESLRPPSYSSASQPEFEATSAVQNHS